MTMNLQRGTLMYNCINENISKSTELGNTEQHKEKMLFLHLKQIISQEPYRFSVLAPQK